MKLEELCISHLFPTESHKIKQNKTKSHESSEHQPEMVESIDFVKDMCVWVLLAVNALIFALFH